MANEHGFNLPCVISNKRNTEVIKKGKKLNVHWKTKLVILFHFTVPHFEYY